MSVSDTVTVTVMKREYRIACPPEEREFLLRSADLVDRKMTEIGQQGKSSGNERIAIMAAINIAYELLQSQHQETTSELEMNTRLQQLRGEIDRFLQQGQLEL